MIAREGFVEDTASHFRSVLIDSIANIKNSFFARSLRKAIYRNVCNLRMVVLEVKQRGGNFVNQYT
jgi:hypothetical protein